MRKKERIREFKTLNCFEGVVGRVFRIFTEMKESAKTGRKK